MLFENVNQFKRAKETLIEMEGDIDMTCSALREMEEFYNMDDTEIKFAVIELYEGLGDKIINFLGSAFGGDIRTLKTVLSQMKDQELKFNEEEYNIHNEFYDILAKQRQLEKDRSNPNYTEMMGEISARKKALNIRMNELTRTHEDIFDALELKVKDLTGDNNRKKKYFNAQRANDVLLTKNDRYDKIKAITQKSSRREKELEDFFGVTKEDLRKDVQTAREDAQKAESSLDGKEIAPPFDPKVFVANPEKDLADKLNTFDAISDQVEKLKKLKSLKNEIRGIFMGPEYKTYGEEQKRNIHAVYDQVSRKIKDLS